MHTHETDRLYDYVHATLTYPSLSLSYIYIYIYIYKTVLVVTKSLCRFVANQVQYNMESVQYLR